VASENFTLAAEIRRHAAELAALAPDVILASGGLRDDAPIAFLLNPASSLSEPERKDAEAAAAVNWGRADEQLSSGLDYRKDDIIRVAQQLLSKLPR
jgi:hypothetical protein